MPTDRMVRDRIAILQYYDNVLASPQTAHRFTAQVRLALDRLNRNPYIHAVSRKPIYREAKIREQLVGSYVILYRVEGNVVLLLRLLHQSQDPTHVVVG